MFFLKRYRKYIQQIKRQQLKDYFKVTIDLNKLDIGYTVTKSNAYQKLTVSNDKQKTSYVLDRALSHAPSYTGYNKSIFRHMTIEYRFNKLSIMKKFEMAFDRAGNKYNSRTYINQVITQGDVFDPTGDIARQIMAHEEPEVDITDRLDTDSTYELSNWRNGKRHGKSYLYDGHMDQIFGFQMNLPLICISNYNNDALHGPKTVLCYETIVAAPQPELKIKNIYDLADILKYKKEYQQSTKRSYVFHVLGFSVFNRGSLIHDFIFNDNHAPLQHKYKLKEYKGYKNNKQHGSEVHFKYYNDGLVRISAKLYENGELEIPEQKFQYKEAIPEGQQDNQQDDQQNGMGIFNIGPFILPGHNLPAPQNGNDDNDDDNILDGNIMDNEIHANLLEPDMDDFFGAVIAEPDD